MGAQHTIARLREELEKKDEQISEYARFVERVRRLAGASWNDGLPKILEGFERNFDKMQQFQGMMIQAEKSTLEENARLWYLHRSLIGDKTLETAPPNVNPMTGHPDPRFTPPGF